MAEQPRHTPFHGLFDMFAEMNRMREHWTDTDPSAEHASSAWVPAVDIYAAGEDLVVRCELAGIPKRDVEVSLSDGQLWISGERRDPPEDPTYYVRERRFGQFRRVITLPAHVDGDQIHASVVAGLLYVVLGGGAGPGRRRESIEIEESGNGASRLDVRR
jgi:HSP20 family protein